MHKSLLALNKLLPLVAIGTIADCQSILDPTNRLLVKSGLQILKGNDFDLQGLKHLLKQTGLAERMRFGHRLNSQDLAFIFAPILNSSGRIEHAKFSIALLLAEKKNSKKHLQLSELKEQEITNEQLSKDQIFAQKILENRSLQSRSAGSLAQQLVEINEKRKRQVTDLSVKVQKQVQAQEKQTELGDSSEVLWCFLPEEHKGLFGLIASRLVSEYQKPVVVVGVNYQQNLSIEQETQDQKLIQIRHLEQIFQEENLLRLLSILKS